MEDSKTGKEIRTLLEKYKKQNNCCFDFLGYEKVPAGMTFEEAFETYIGMMQMVEGDRFIHIRDNDDITEYKQCEDGSQEEKPVMIHLN